MRPRLWLIAACLAPLAALAEPPSSAPLFEQQFVDLDGQPANLAKFRGRPLIINFWARWCGPCRTEIPDLVAERARRKDQELEVVGIAIEDNTESVRDFAKAYDIDYPVLLAKDAGIELMRTLGNSRAGLPYTLVLDRRGQIVSSKLGPMRNEEMAAAFASALR
jgi:thiol-disulfide isomerase/thioredoxin